MSRPQVKITSLGITGVVGLAVACSGAPTGPDATRASVATPAPTATPSATPAAPSSSSPGQVLARFDGSFDSTTKKLTFSLHPNEPGVIVAQGALSYGLSPGQVYLHTDPSLVFGTEEVGEDVLNAGVYPENGTGATIPNFTVTIDSLSPAGSVGIVQEGGSPGIFSCLGAALAGTTDVFTPPCSLNYGSVPASPGFPTPFLDPQLEAGWFFYTAGGANFTFTGTVSSSSSVSDRRVKRNVRALAEAMPARRARGKKRRR